MDDLLNKTRYNNLIRPATSSAQLISIRLQLSVAQLISLVGAGGGPRGTFSALAVSWGKGWPFSVQGWELGDLAFTLALPGLVDKVPDSPSDPSLCV